MKRKYEFRRRAERQEETRRRIVAAAVQLHQTLGPARSTVSAIAELAGVQRHTFYRHFPEELALFKACIQHYMAAHPLPDPEAWLETPDAIERVRQGLSQAYGCYERDQAMMTNVLRDREVMGPPIGSGFLNHRKAMLEVLMKDWRASKSHRLALEAIIRLALDFHTWKELRAAGLGNQQAADLMTQFVACTAGRANHRP
jgi:AcrR family transcriptional regulator